MTKRAHLKINYEQLTALLNLPEGTRIDAVADVPSLRSFEVHLSGVGTEVPDGSESTIVGLDSVKTLDVEEVARNLVERVSARGEQVR